MEQSTQQCPHCRKHLTRNFRIHEIQCARMNHFCEKCQEPIPLQSLQDHLSSHLLVECFQCGDSLETQFINIHLEFECPHTPQLQQQHSSPASSPPTPSCCPFCHLAYPSSALPEHSAACGARTELCMACDAYVQLHHLARHISTGCKYPRTLVDTTVTLADFLVPQHQENLTLSDFESLSLEGVAAFSPSLNLPAELTSAASFPAELSGLFSAEESFLEHASNLMHSRGGHVREVWMLDDVHQESELSEILIPCEHCHEPIEADDYQEHYSSCVDPMESFSLSDKFSLFPSAIKTRRF